MYIHIYTQDFHDTRFLVGGRFFKWNHIFFVTSVDAPWYSLQKRIDLFMLKKKIITLISMLSIQSWLSRECVCVISDIEIFIIHVYRKSLTNKSRKCRENERVWRRNAAEFRRIKGKVEITGKEANDSGSGEEGGCGCPTATRRKAFSNELVRPWHEAAVAARSH